MVEALAGIVALVLMFLPFHFFGDHEMESAKSGMLVLMMCVWMAVIAGLYIHFFF